MQDRVVNGITSNRASELILEWGRKREGRERGMGFLGRGQPAPPHQLGGLRERCKLPQRGPKGFLVFCAFNRLPFSASQYVLHIQFAWLGIRFFWGDPHAYRPLPTSVCGTVVSSTRPQSYASDSECFLAWHSMLASRGNKIQTAVLFMKRRIVRQAWGTSGQGLIWGNRSSN